MADPEFDDDDRDDDYEPDHLRDNDREQGCTLGDRCCCPHPFHGSDECFTAEWAEEYYAEHEDKPADEKWRQG